MTVGGAEGVTTAWTGEKASASTTAAQRSLAASGVRAPVVASVRRVASSAGNGTPALGGRDDSRNARTTRPTSSATVMSASHWSCSSFWRRSSAARSCPASSRVLSSRATTGSAPAVTTDRRSRRSSSSTTASAASARSSHSATRTEGRRSCARDSMPLVVISGLPSAASIAF